MKNEIHGIIIALTIFLVSLIPARAIEDIRVSIQSSNVVLSWPSLTNETYIAQYRENLAITDSWVTLTNYYPASQTTNITSLILSNSVIFGTLGSGGGTNAGGGIPDPTGTNDYSGTPGTNGVAGTGFYRVVRNGVHMWGITNGMVVSNVLITSIEFAVGTTDEIMGVTFCDTNDVPIIGASAQPGENGGWVLVWNTTQSFNGQYAICAELNFATTNSVLSEPVTVTVNNIISFPNYFSQIYGAQMWLYAATIPDAAYEIDLYDENTNYLGSFDGDSDDTGTISFLWDLTDGEGVTHDDTNFFGVFTVDTSSLPEAASKVAPVSARAASLQTASPVVKTLSTAPKNRGVHPNDFQTSASATQLWAKEGVWTPNNAWVLAYSPLTDPVTDPNTSTKESLMMLGGEDGEDIGVIGALDGNDFHGNISPGNVPQTSAFELGDTTSRGELLGYLNSTYENFYYFGHGNDSAISSFNAPATGITAQQIAYALGNVPLSQSSGPGYLINTDPPIMEYPVESTHILHAALHPYRFVFLDGCDTGAGNFCESFGIPAVTATTNFFASAGVEARAFIGFTDEKNFNTATWDSYSLMMGGFFEDWVSGHFNVETCVGHAQNGAYESVVNMDSSAVIFGAVDMELNTRTRP